jgi:UDP-glucuronate 4-epimerase
MNILITGTAGFIGFHLVRRLVNENFDIVGLDNINKYYDTELKYDRLKETGISKDKIISSNRIKLLRSENYKNYRFVKMDLLDKKNLLKLFEQEKFDYVVHLAAQAGVRYSLKNPQAYIDSNIVGFFNILEACRQNKPKHLIFASSSSVYGNNTEIPFSTSHKTDEPISLYAATKKSNEVMAYAYSSLYDIPTTGLRFFTVYGPWGRPDMAYYSFSKNIIEGKPIQVFNTGKLKRDFTYIDDIVKMIFKLIKVENIKSSQSKPKYKLFNIGNSKPVDLLYFISLLEKYLDKKAILKMEEMQKGDVRTTYSDCTEIINYLKYKPQVDIEVGLKKFINWFKKYY